MTDNEIIKALECMLGKYSIGEQIDCSGCAFETQGLCCENASEGIVKVSLALITRQKAEIKRCKHTIKMLQGYVANERAEAIKEFAERLKKECLFDSGWCVMPTDGIDNLVKEMVGDV